MNKKCELCKGPARIFCESDQATLCWDCDTQVHAANFLVARHSRTLLCRACHSPTPWNASGARLGNTISFCHRCAAEEETAENDVGNDGAVMIPGDNDGDIQFVPSSSTPPPPPASSVEAVSDGDDEDKSEPVTTTTTLIQERENNNVPDRDFQEDRPKGSASKRRCSGGE
ncbi:PREDICTED: putative zinc finger protein CONSTANS-LIKE 11 isoform X2 [Lupinus angustifolius]|uniref:putative zinc finger protein CONSTANS-LIKE 11 isoform X2 n=1 Tax=Lupinus angustifolius TaxID=3871 RepID=UPI00092F68C9|nr:PREDICTED: putative zinc finger protein CONSTANS-LIKE 11 isoform X2 [Lupinus angustifolius]